MGRFFPQRKTKKTQQPHFLLCLTATVQTLKTTQQTTGQVILCLHTKKVQDPKIKKLVYPQYIEHLTT